METALISEEVLSNETLKTIYGRRSVRRYKDIPVDDKIIEQIIDAGRMAPSAMMNQHWKFYVLTEKETIKSFSDEIIKVFSKDMIQSGIGGIVKLTASALYSLYYGHLLKGPNVFYDAPVVIFITAPRDEGWACYDISMCAQNMMLAAKSLGLDSCPLGVGKYVEHTKLYYKLRAPYPEEVFLAVAIGYGDENPKAHERIKDNVIFVDRLEKEE